MVRVAVIGGGITGLGTALMLGRQGHAVTLFEQDLRAAGADPELDFHRWDRPRVPQAVQPHSFLAPVRKVLLTETPDVYADLLARGAREYHDFDWFDRHPPSLPGDEDLVTVRARRIVLEAALTAAVACEPTVSVRQGSRIEGLVFAAGGIPRVTGVRAGGEPVEADLVIDASGRRSKVTDWLAQGGCREPVVETHRAGIAYFCRWYQLRADGPADPGRVRTGSSSGFAHGGVFPSDNGSFAVNLVLATSDPSRGALADPRVFEDAARLFPAAAAWFALRPEPRSAVLAMAGLDNRWTSLGDRDGPVVMGLVNAGDSLLHTNPTFGHGAALGLLTAQYLAAHDGEVAADPTAYHSWTATELRPWFDLQVASDTGEAERLAAGSSPPDRRSAARAACALEEPVVMRARAQARHLVKSPEDAYGNEEVEQAVTAWMASHPDFEPAHDGPTREQWNACLSG